MHKKTNHQQDSQRLAIVLFEQFSNHCLANLLEPFRAANSLADQELYTWQFLTMDGEPAVSSSGLPVLPHAPISELVPCDMLCVVSSYGHEQLDTVKTRETLRRAGRKSRRICGFDSGAWLMASAGLMDGYRATIHRDLARAMEERFLNVEVVSNRFVIDRDRITCGGAMTAFDLVLCLIGQDHGAELSLDVADLFLHPSSGEIQLAPRPAREDIADFASPVDRAIGLMRSHIETPLRITDISLRVGVQPKQLQRLFYNRLGLMPRDVYQHIRLREVQRLMENTSLPAAEIAVRGGYENASAMSRAFKAKFGYSPTTLRSSSLRNAKWRQVT